MLTGRQYKAMRQIDETNSREGVDETTFVDLLCLRYVDLDETTWKPFIHNMGDYVMWKYENRAERSKAAPHVLRLQEALEKSSGEEVTVSRFDLQLLMNDADRSRK